MKVLIVGSGISGLVAGHLLRQAGHKVLILETREHLGGNCYDEPHRETGMMLHKYGPHCLHTNSETVANFLFQFSKFNGYSPEVWGRLSNGIRIPVPFNEVSAEIVGEKTPEEIRDLVFVDYSEKMWGRPWEQIPENIRKRLPTKRETRDLKFHQTKYVGVPLYGWTELLKGMAEGCEVQLACGTEDWRKARSAYDLVVYTGKLDAYFGYVHGRLPYRSLDITVEVTTRQEVFQLNECNRFNKWTRACDQSYWYDQPTPNGTVVTKEYSLEHTEENEPYYPMRPFDGATEMWEQYDLSAKQESATVFLGRLAGYTYIDMGVAVGTALNKIKSYV